MCDFFIVVEDSGMEAASRGCRGSGALVISAPDPRQALSCTSWVLKATVRFSRSGRPG